MNWIFSRFPDETVKIPAANRWKFGTHILQVAYNTIYRTTVAINSSMMLFFAKRIAYCRFHPETGNQKNPNNPVNPVYLKY